MELEIREHLNKFNYDVRITKDARFSDQKCTPDVVCIIADCVLNIRNQSENEEFTVKDIWDSQYFIKHVKSIFNKPSAQNPTTRSEYDKFIQQPLRLLAYAQILTIEKRGNVNYYTIGNYSLLEYIALKDRNSFVFLYYYFEKVLKDSNMLQHFTDYKSKYNNGTLSDNDFNSLKYKFQRFLIGNTNINGETEVNRIFPKVINVYACQNVIPGSIKGRMSKYTFSYSDLMYNRPNWRDGNKNKQLSRQEAIVESQNDAVSDFDAYLIQKAISNIKKWHVQSEVNDQWANGEATQVHHIFPVNEFPSLAHYVENLIRLTPTQHFTKAHPGNKTKSINRDYQCVCLVAKSQSIEKSILSFGERYYKKALFTYVVNSGLQLETDREIRNDMTFNDIRSSIINFYNQT